MPKIAPEKFVLTELHFKPKQFDLVRCLSNCYFTMYFAIKLVFSDEKKIVPLKWIQNLDMAQLWNYGIDNMKKNRFKVFISENTSAEPDFQFDVKNNYDKRRPACYIATIVSCFGKCSSI